MKLERSVNLDAGHPCVAVDDGFICHSKPLTAIVSTSTAGISGLLVLSLAGALTCTLAPPQAPSICTRPPC